MATENHKMKAAAQTSLYMVVVAAIVVVANMLAAGAPARIDTTKTERFTLSPGSGRLVAGLKDELVVEAYVKTGFAQLDAFVADLTNLLGEYERASGGKFKYTIIEPDTDELRQQAREAGLQEQPFGEADATGDDRASITQGFLGLVLKNGKEKEVIPGLHPAYSEGLEFMISNKIREIKDRNEGAEHKIGVITGKQELALTDRNLVPRQGQQGSPSIQEVLTQNFPFYAFENVELKEGVEAINPELEGLVITQPGSDFSEDELRRVDEFLMLGEKTLLVVASAVNLKKNDPQMMAELNLHGLEPLLEGYGIKMNKDAVLDHGAQFRILVQAMGGIGWRRHPGLAHVTADPRFEGDEQFLDTSFAGFFRMDELMMPFPSSLEILEDKQPEGVTVRPVMRTTPAAQVVTDETVDMSMRDQWQPMPPFEQKVIAAVAEGPLKSAFAGSAKEGFEVPEQAPKESGVLVIASSQFITNPFAYAGNGPEMTGQMAQFGAMGGDPELQQVGGAYAQKYLRGTIIAMKNIFDWMSGDADLVAASAKILGEPALTYKSVAKPDFSLEDSEAEALKKDEEYRVARRSLQTSVQWSLILGLPLIFIGIGALRLTQRDRRRKQKVDLKQFEAKA